MLHNSLQTFNEPSLSQDGFFIFLGKVRHFLIMQAVVIVHFKNGLKKIYSMLRKLRTIIYHVNDLQRAKDWYTLVTGIKPYFDESYYVGFNIYGCELGLDPDLSEVISGTQSVAYWLVDDIEASVKTFTAEGAKIISAIQNVGGSVRVATVEDPFGNAIGLIEEKQG